MPTLLALLPIILQYGVPFAEQIFKMFNSPAGPTQADWDSLKLLSTTTARQNMLDTLKSHNIDPASPAGVALLTLTPA